MSRALILTVGTGSRVDSDIVRSLKKTVRNSNPQRVVFLVTEASADIARQIRAQLVLPDGVASEVAITNLDDVEQTYLCALGALRGLRDEGFAPAEIDADYTSGTKAMTAGLALAAVAFGCGTLKYVSGQREHGVVIPGSERFLAIPPAVIVAHRELATALGLFRELQFEAARRVLSVSSGQRLLTGHDAGVFAGLQALIDGYDAWDKFAHGRFNQPYRQVDFALPEMRPFQLAEGIGPRVQAMHDALRHKNWRERLTADHLADLWNNAARRRHEGKHDDAVARLYRLTEMTAQYVLAREYDVNTADVQPETLALSLEHKERLERHRRRGKVRIGLREGFELLRALGSPLGVAFEQNTTLQGLLDRRNGSILAHGQQRVQAKDANDLAAEVAALADVAVGDFARHCAELQFPWLPAGEQSIARAATAD